MAFEAVGSGCWLVALYGMLYQWLTRWCMLQCFNVALKSELSSGEAATLSWCVLAACSASGLASTPMTPIKTDLF